MLSSEDIKKLFRLGKLASDDASIETAKVQINNIFNYIEVVRNVDVKDVVPMSHVHGSFNVFRQDERQELLTTEEALSNVPDRSGSFIRVPLIIETE